MSLQNNLREEKAGKTDESLDRFGLKVFDF